jgi:hypothetical protein
MGFGSVTNNGDSLSASRTWDRFLLPTDLPTGMEYYPAAASAASFTPVGAQSDWNSFFSPGPSASDLLFAGDFDERPSQILAPEDALRFISLTDSNSG